MSPGGISISHQQEVSPPELGGLCLRMLTGQRSATAPDLEPFPKQWKLSSSSFQAYPKEAVSPQSQGHTQAGRHCRGFLLGAQGVHELRGALVPTFHVDDPRLASSLMGPLSSRVWDCVTAVGFPSHNPDTYLNHTRKGFSSQS